MREDTLDAMLTAYNDELTQIRYTPEYATLQRLRSRKTATQKTKNKLTDAALLKKLEGFSAPTTDPPKKGSVRRR
jgi:hypothetical protein